MRSLVSHPLLGQHMKTIKLAEAQAALQAIANQKGRAGYDRAKSAFLDDKLIVDDNDAPVSEVKYEEPTFVEKSADAPDESNAEKSDPQFVLSTMVEKAIAKQLGAIRPAQKQLRIEGADDDRRRSARRGTTRYMKSHGDARKDAEAAHDFGRWIQAVTFGDRASGAADYCRKKGIGFEFGEFDENDRFIQKSITGHSESVNADGGFLVPPEFDSEILWLREQYGVVRRRARRVSMLSDTKSYSRKTSSHTAYYNAEGATNTTSKMAFDRITLVAKKLRIDGYLTEELSEDAAVNVGDEAANDIAETFAKKEDTDAFIGDGTSTYGGIVGFQRAFLNLGTVSNSVGIYDTAGTTNTYATITLPQIMDWMSRLPAFADNPNTAIFCHKLFFHAVFQRLEVGAGGVTMTEITNGSPVHRFMGYPVEFVQALPKTPTADVPDAFMGDMTKCADFGDRRGMTFKTTDIGGNAWANDEIAYKASQRWDFQIHDVGNNTSTAANQLAGPMIALIVT